MSKNKYSCKEDAQLMNDSRLFRESCFIMSKVVSRKKNQNVFGLFLPFLSIMQLTSFKWNEIETFYDFLCLSQQFSSICMVLMPLTLWRIKNPNSINATSRATTAVHRWSEWTHVSSAAHTLQTYCIFHIQLQLREDCKNKSTSEYHSWFVYFEGMHGYFHVLAVCTYFGGSFRYQHY